MTWWPDIFCMPASYLLLPDFFLSVCFKFLLSLPALADYSCKLLLLNFFLLGPCSEAVRTLQHFFQTSSIPTVSFRISFRKIQLRSQVMKKGYFHSSFQSEMATWRPTNISCMQRWHPLPYHRRLSCRYKYKYNYKYNYNNKSTGKTNTNTKGMAI